MCIRDRNISRDIQVIGVQSEASPAMYESLRKGEIVKVKLEHSIAEGLHGNIEDGSITFKFVKEHVDEIFLVSENEIKKAIRDLYELEGILIEGAAGVTLAALEKYKTYFKGRNMCLVLSGGNIDPQHLIEILS